MVIRRYGRVALIRGCSACGNSAKKVVFPQPLVVPQGCLYGGYNVVMCSQCGFCYADDTLSQHALDEYYEGLNRTGVTYYEPEGARERDTTVTSVRAANIAPLLKETDRILDVGCGTGNFLGLLRSAGYPNVHGVEPSALAVKVGKEKYGIDLFHGSLFDYDLPSQFDFVIVSHVLEHVIDLERFINRLKDLMSRDGHLYLEVPDVHQFHRFSNPLRPEYSLYVRDLFAHFSPEHVNFFSPVSLRLLMTGAGFEEVSCRSEHKTGVVASAWRRALSQTRPLCPYDLEAETSLDRYIAESASLQSPCLETLKEVTAGNGPIIVWGAGLHTQRLLGSGAMHERDIIAFVDSDNAYRDCSLAGKPIVPPSALPGLPLLPILISSWKSQAAIHRTINGMNLPNKVILPYPAFDSIGSTA